MRTRRTSGRPTLSDVAAKASVSPITVSRALRDPGKVSQKLKDLINSAISELNYIPDPNARALASARSDVIGVLIPSLSNNVFNDVLNGIYSQISGRKYHIQIGNTRYSEREEERLVRLFIGQGPAALIVTGIDQSAQTRSLLENANCPVVQIMEITDDPIDMVVGFNHMTAAKEIAQHLVQQDYKKIAIISAHIDPRAQRRLDGYRSVMRDAGLYDPGLEINTDAPSSVKTGRKLASQLLDARPDIDAFFCNNDDLAQGALFAAQARGLNIPEEIGIAGFNDMEFMAATHPALTSLATFREKMGTKAAALAIQKIEGFPVKGRQMDLGYSLAIRQSTRRT